MPHGLSSFSEQYGTTALIGLGTVILFVATKYVSSVRSWRAKERQHHAVPPRNDRAHYGILIFLRFLFGTRHKLERIPHHTHSDHEHWGNTFATSILNQRIVFTREPENMEAILSSHFHDFGVEPVRHKSFQRLLGDGIFSVDGQKWHDARRLLRPHFTKSQINDFDPLEADVAQFLQMLMAQAAAGATVDLMPHLYALAMDTGTRFTVGAQGQAMVQRAGFAEEWQKALHGVLTIHQYDDRLARWIMKDWSGFEEAVKLCRDSLAAQIPADAKERAGDGRNVSYLEHIASVIDDREKVVDQAMNTFLASRDTTAATLGWAFRVISRKPTVFQQLRAEIVGRLGEGAAAERPTVQTLRELKYLQSFIAEPTFLRLYGPVAINAKFALTDTVLPRGGGRSGDQPMLVAKGDAIEYNPFSMHRRTDLYGADAEEFRPERWSEGQSLVPYSYVPFSAGPRACLGQELAMNNLGYTIVRVLQRCGSMTAQAPIAEETERDYASRMMFVMAPITVPVVITAV